MPTSPWRPRQTRDVPFSRNSITPTSPKLPQMGKFWGSQRNGISAKGDITGLLQTSGGNWHSGIWALVLWCCLLGDRKSSWTVSKSQKFSFRGLGRTWSNSIITGLLKKNSKVVNEACWLLVLIILAPQPCLIVCSLGLISDMWYIAVQKAVAGLSDVYILGENWVCWIMQQLCTVVVMCGLLFSLHLCTCCSLQLKLLHVA